MDMTSVRRQDTGDCSFPPPFLQSGALGKGIPLMMIEISFLTAFFLPNNSSTRSAISAVRRIESKVAGYLRLDRMDASGLVAELVGYVEHEWWCLLLLIKKYCVFSALVGDDGDG